MLNSDAFSQYGDVQWSHLAHGEILLDDSTSHECTIGMAQLGSGQLMVRCSDIAASVPYQVQADCVLGQTELGTAFTTVGPLMSVEREEAWCVIDETLVPRTSLTFFASEIRIGKRPVGVGHVRFWLTNLHFHRRAVKVVDDGVVVAPPLALPFRGRTVNVTLERASGYCSLDPPVRTRHGVAVTAYLQIPLSDTLPLDEATQVAGYVSCLLSVAAGTKIQWVHFDILGSDLDHPKYAVRSSRFAKSYVAQPLIDLYEDGELERFIIGAWPSFLAKNDRYQLEQGLVDSYLDAKASGDGLEIRGAKLAVALEMVKAGFERGPGGDQYIIDPILFSKMVPGISASIKSVLTSHGLDETTANSLLSEGKLSELNRHSFRSVLTKLNEDLGRPITAKNIHQLVASRNSLIHSGQFACQHAEHRGSQSLHDAVEEYYQLCSILDRLMLGLLGYRGTYNEWSAPRSESRQSQMFTFTKLRLQRNTLDVSPRDPTICRKPD